MAYTPLLGLSLPVTGTLSGTWGDEINNSITSLLDSSVAGTTTLSTDADVTLTTTTGSANQARAAVLLCTGARTGVRYITAPAQSKTYTVVNATTGGFDVYIRGVGPTAGIAVPSGYAVQVAWNSSDFVQTSVPVTKISGLGANVATFLATPSSANLAAALTDETGTGANVFATTPTLVTPILGTPTSVTLTNATGLPISTGVSGLGTGVATALAVNVGTAGSPVVNGGALGTPSSGTVTNLTGTANITVTGGASGAIAATTLSASSTVSGTGFSNFLASPPAIGGTTAAAGSFTSLTDSGNLTFTGTGNRITGDFSNATVANRVAFQTSTANSTTWVSAIPSGTSAASRISAYNNSDQTNSARISIAANATDVQINSAIEGTGTYVPMTFATGGTERVRVDTSGNVGIGTVSATGKLDVEVASGVLYTNFSTTAGGAASVFSLLGGSASEQAICYNSTALRFGLVTGKNAAGFLEKLRITSGGDVTVMSAALLGYGTGSGGTVTQATSKSTAVTLNKPTGQITMNNAALAAGAVVAFQCGNSLVGQRDLIIANVAWGPIDPTNYSIKASAFLTAAGTILFQLKNESAVSLSEAVVINFAIIKGSIT